MYKEQIINILVSIIIGYIIGSIPTGYLYCKTKGINIFDYGSGNPGSTNVGRVLGKKDGHIVFTLDLIKSIIPTVLYSYIVVMMINYKYNNFSDSALYRMITAYFGMGCIIGHNYPIFSKFKGGKGISCTLGVALSYDPIFALIALLIFIIVKYTSKFVSLASIVAELCIWIGCMFLSLMKIYPFEYYLSELVIPAFTVISILCIYRHKSNIVKLMSGTEYKITDKINIK